MTAHYETISFENIEKYRTFNITAEMDEVIYRYIDILRQDERPESVIEVLLFLGRSSLRVTGVSFPKNDTIAEKVGVSLSTVKRAIKTLLEYGMIKRIPTVRKWKGFGRRKQKAGFITVILSEHKDDKSRQVEPANDAEEVNQDKAESIESHSEPFDLKHSSNSRTRDGKRLYCNNTRDDIRYGITEDERNKRGLKTAIPRVIYDGLSPFFDAKELFEKYGILLRAKAKVNRSIRFEDYGEEYVDEFYNVIRRHKLGQVRNMSGLLYSAWQRVTGEISRRISYENENSTLRQFEDFLSAR